MMSGVGTVPKARSGAAIFDPALDMKPTAERPGTACSFSLKTTAE
jgi:hypothetical protein